MRIHRLAHIRIVLLIANMALLVREFIPCWARGGIEVLGLVLLLLLRQSFGTSGHTCHAGGLLRRLLGGLEVWISIRAIDVVEIVIVAMRAALVLTLVLIPIRHLGLNRKARVATALRKYGATVDVVDAVHAVDAVDAIHAIHHVEVGIHQVHSVHSIHPVHPVHWIHSIHSHPHHHRIHHEGVEAGHHWERHPIASLHLREIRRHHVCGEYVITFRGRCRRLFGSTLLCICFGLRC